MAGRCRIALFWTIRHMFHRSPKRASDVGQGSPYTGRIGFFSRSAGQACVGTSQAFFGAHQLLNGEVQTRLQECKPAWVASLWNAQVIAWLRIRPGQTGANRFAAREGHFEIGACRKLCQTGDMNEAVDALTVLVQQGLHVPNYLFYLVLKRCIMQTDLVLGCRVHALAVDSGFEGDNFLATHLIGLYATNERSEEAMLVFLKVPVPDAYNWAAIILALAKLGEPAQAVGLYWKMRELAVEPDNCVFVAVLKACANARDLTAGKSVHAHILASVVIPDTPVLNCLVDMYAKCGCVEGAQKVFNSIPMKNVVSWTSLIAGYVQEGMGQEALIRYRSMQQEGISRPNLVTFICVLQACACVGVTALDEGKRVHAEIEERLPAGVVVGNCLVNMYAKCGNLEDARRVFDSLHVRDLVTWNSMITAYAQHGMGQEALGLYKSLQQEAIHQPDSATFVSLLQACFSVGGEFLHEGKKLHAEIYRRGLLRDLALGNSLISMYAKCGSLEDAESIFETLPQKNVVTWTAMMAEYVNQGLCQEALDFYRRMQQETVTPPNSVTFVCLLRACAVIGVAALDQGKQLHVEIEAQGLQADVVVGGSLVNMYAKCGHLEDAQRIFDNLSDKNVVTWNAMITGYVQQGMGQTALGLYSRMQQEGINLPDAATFVCLLQACAGLGEAALNQGQQLHAHIEDRGYQSDVVVGGSLVTMYAQCGSLEHARRVFEGMSQKDVVTWNVIITGYNQQGMTQEALGLYSTMKEEGLIQPNRVTFLLLLEACSALAALPRGRELHVRIGELGLENDVVVSCSLVHMYAKCGSMVDSQQVFDSLSERCAASWNALIAGYAHQGNIEMVCDLVHEMRQDGRDPDGVTFLSVLSVCSHLGLVDRGRKYFEAMSGIYGIEPAMEHYICMMDLLGRAGHLAEALRLVKTMPFQPNGAVWHALLGACQKWCNIEIGREAFEFALQVDETDAAAYAVMSNIYRSVKMWEEAKGIQARRVKYGACRQPGQSWCADMSGVVYAFIAEESEHLRTAAS